MDWGFYFKDLLLKYFGGSETRDIIGYNVYACVCLGRLGVLGLWFLTSQIWMFVRTFWSNHGTFMECIKFNDDMINISHTPHADEHAETHTFHAMH